LSTTTAQVGGGGRHRRVVLAVGLFALAQLVIVLGGFADNGALCDDAFYYFQIAKHAVEGSGFSFDGLHATNGFHPLFCWLALPVFALTSSAWLPIRVLMCLLALASAGTGYVVYRVGRSLGDERAGELMALLFLLSPFTWIIPLRGCEGSLAVLCVALALWQATSMREIATVPLLKLGALVGLAGLARTENVFLALGMVAWLATRTRQWRHYLAFAGAAALVVSPWLVWNLAQFGTIVQVSGSAKAAFHLTHGLPFGLTNVPSNLYAIASVPTQFVMGEDMAPTRWTHPMVLFNAVIVAVAVAAGGRRRPPIALLPIAVLVVLHITYYAVVQRSYFNWYVMPLVLGVALLQGERLSRASRTVTSGVITATALSCALTLFAFYQRYPRAPHQPEQRVAGAVAVIDSLPYGAHAGTWNAGAIGYFGSQRRPDVTIFNLDCVVNNQLFTAWRDGVYTQWVIENVGWLVEHPSKPLNPNVVVQVNDGLWRVAPETH
jgi:4-amino-4-deoxy-L-arabinose transferase-like glycosyltransferase